jgi:L-histidine N-alpha-methyltransferase
LVAFLGSTIGNFRPEERRRFLVDLECTMGAFDRLLLGVDLVKDPDRLRAAYDDAAGVTAAFNRNALSVVNRELGGDFDPEAFDHVARWVPEERWIEMRLRARSAQHVRIEELDLEVDIAEGEELLTEISAKFTHEGIGEELTAAGFVVERTWVGGTDDFLLVLARPYC